MFIELFTYEFVSIFNITRWALLFKIVTHKVKFKKILKNFLWKIKYLKKIFCYFIEFFEKIFLIDSF